MHKIKMSSISVYSEETQKLIKIIFFGEEEPWVPDSLINDGYIRVDPDDDEYEDCIEETCFPQPFSLLLSVRKHCGELYDHIRDLEANYKESERASRDAIAKFNGNVHVDGDKAYKITAEGDFEFISTIIK